MDSGKECPPQVICHVLPDAVYAVPCMDMTMEPRYLSEAGKLEESSGTERRGVHQALRVSNQIKQWYHRRP